MAKCTGMRCPMQVGYKVNECNHKDCPYRTEPVTNADIIRLMSDEELANIIDNELDHCPPRSDCEKMSKDCKACWLNCLQSPAGKNLLKYTKVVDK